MFLTLMFIALYPAFAQERPLNTGLNVDEQYAFIGMTVAGVIERFGPPRAVAAARGTELWQDDVVFQYTGVDFYIYNDRVWQVRLITTHGVSNGDAKRAVLSALGNTAQDMDDHVLLPINGRTWPMMMRVNFNNSGLTSAIYIYRSDF